MNIILKNQTNKDILLFCAFRYALGRSTYAVSSIVEILIDNWSGMAYHQKVSYQNEIRIAISKENIGMDMDLEEWNKILDLPLGERNE